MVSVLFAPQCYAVAGELKGILRLAIGVAMLTLSANVFRVRKELTDVVTNPETLIPSLEQLLAVVPAAQAATLAAQIAANMGAGLNLHINTGFYADANGWTLSANVVRDTSKSLFGAYVVKSEQSGLGTDAWRGISTLTANRIPCELNDNFTGSVWLFFDNASLFDQPIRIEVAIYDASGTRITSASYDYTPVAADQNRWIRIFVNRLANVEGAASAGIAVSVRRNGRAWFACPKLERYTNGTPSDWRPSWADILALPYGEDWKQPTMLNGAAEVGSGHVVRYCRDAQGWVRFKGRLNPAGMDLANFNLPAGYRPAINAVFLFPRGDNSAGCIRGYVSSAGDFILNISATSTWIDISGMSYKAEA